MGTDRSTAGLTLFEVLVSIVLLSFGLLALGAAAGSSLKRASLSSRDMHQWTDVTRVADSLTALGWGNVTGGSRSAAHLNIAWAVTTVSADLERVDIVVGRRQALGYGATQDTLTLFLSNPVP